MTLPSWLKLDSLVKNLNLSSSLNIQKDNKNTSVQQKSNITYNAPIYNIGIGNPSDLLEKGSIIDEPIFRVYENGLKTLDLADTQIDRYGEFLNDFYEKKAKKFNVQITRNAMTMLKGAIFALDTKKLNNYEWKEHCASSLREIFHEWPNGDLSNDFALLYKSKEDGLTDEEKLYFKEFKNRYEYFSGVDHHDSSKILFSMRALKNDQNIKFNFCHKDEVFINEVKDFFVALAKMINFTKEK